MLLAGILYLGLTRLVTIPLGKGGFEKYEARAGRAPALQPVADSEVSL